MVSDLETKPQNTKDLPPILAEVHASNLKKAFLPTSTSAQWQYVTRPCWVQWTLTGLAALKEPPLSSTVIFWCFFHCLSSLFILFLQCSSSFSLILILSCSFFLHFSSLLFTSHFASLVSLGLPFFAKTCRIGQLSARTPDDGSIIHWDPHSARSTALDLAHALITCHRNLQSPSPEPWPKVHSQVTKTGSLKKCWNVSAQILPGHHIQTNAVGTCGC